jgi:hypothetical protein
MSPRPLLLAAVMLAGCGLSDGRTRCGITALAAPGLLLEEFTREGRTLGAAPESLPQALPVRFAAGSVWRGVVGRTDSGMVVGVEGDLPAGAQPGFGVLLVDPAGGPQGVVLYDGPPIPGAPKLGQVSVGTTMLPLLGLRAPVAGFQDARCPLFPDSLRR